MRKPDYNRRVLTDKVATTFGIMEYENGKWECWVIIAEYKSYGRTFSKIRDGERYLREQYKINNGLTK